jgi:hypothetical protein
MSSEKRFVGRVQYQDGSFGTTKTCDIEELIEAAKSLLPIDLIYLSTVSESGNVELKVVGHLGLTFKPIGEAENGNQETSGDKVGTEERDGSTRVLRPGRSSSGDVERAEREDPRSVEEPDRARPETEDVRGDLKSLIQSEVSEALAPIKEFLSALAENITQTTKVDRDGEDPGPQNGAPASAAPPKSREEFEAEIEAVKDQQRSERAVSKPTARRAKASRRGKKPAHATKLAAQFSHFGKPQ